MPMKVLSSGEGFTVHGEATQEIWSGEMKVTITDRLHRDKPYVRWDRVVYFMNYSAKVGEPGRTALGWAEERQKLAIHKTDPDERCRFADMYTPKLSKDDLNHIDTLPYAESEYKQHAHEFVPTAFLVGPTGPGNLCNRRKNRLKRIRQRTSSGKNLRRRFKQIINLLSQAGMEKGVRLHQLQIKMKGRNTNSE